MTQPDLFTAEAPPDPCARKHGGDDCSRAAWERTKSTKADQRQAVFEAIYAAGDCGLTCAELAERWGVPMHTISGRFSELREMRKIDKDGFRENRGGNKCGVWRVRV